MNGRMGMFYLVTHSVPTDSAIEHSDLKSRKSETVFYKRRTNRVFNWFGRGVKTSLP